MSNDKDFLLKNAVEVGGPTKVTLGTVTSNNIDLATGNYFADTLAANTTYTVSNAGDVQSFQLEVNGGSGAGYNIAGADYDNVALDVSSQDGDVSGLYISPDGLNLYINGQVNDTVFQYALSTAWDLSTASYASKSFSVSSQDANPLNLTFKSDGTKMYILGGSSARVFQYSLSTAWDLSTASYDSVAFDPTAQETTPRGFDFKEDGTKFYQSGAANDTIYQYGLSTAWDLSTASYDSVSFAPTDALASGFPAGLRFGDSGNIFIISNGSNLYKYTLSTSYDLTTASFVPGSFDLTSEDGDPKGGIFLKSDGTKFYSTGGITDSVHQYSSIDAFALTWPSSIEWAGGVAPSAPATGETDVFTLSTDDGGTSYVGVKTADNLS